MSIIQELSQNFSGLSEVLRQTGDSLRRCQADCDAPLAQLRSDGAELGAQAAALRQVLGEMAALATRAGLEAGNAGTEIESLARTLAAQGREGGEQLSARQAQARQAAAAWSAGAAQGVSRVEARGQKLVEQADGAVRHTAEQTSSLANAWDAARGAHEATDAAATSYDPALAAELASHLSTLATDGETAASDTLAVAARPTQGAVRDGYGGAASSAWAQLGESLGSSQSALLARARAAATGFAEGARERFRENTALVAQELPEQARSQWSSSTDPALRRMAEEASKLSLVTGSLAAYLTREQDPLLPAVRELHLALKGMVGK